MAAAFDRLNGSYVEATSSAFQDQGAGSISAWVVGASAILGSTRLPLFFSTNNVNNPRLSININASVSTISATSRRLDGDTTETITSPSGALSNLMHIVAVANWAGASLLLYINGSLVASSAPESWSGNTSNTASARVRSGISVTGSSSVFFTQDLRSYRRALSAAEVKSMWAAKGADRIRKGLLNRWILNNGISGATIGANAVRDYGPGQNHGSGVNNPTWVGAPLVTRPKFIGSMA